MFHVIFSERARDFKIIMTNVLKYQQKKVLSFLKNIYNIFENICQLQSNKTEKKKLYIYFLNNSI